MTRGPIRSAGATTHERGGQPRARHLVAAAAKSRSVAANPTQAAANRAAAPSRARTWEGEWGERTAAFGARPKRTNNRCTMAHVAAVTVAVGRDRARRCPSWDAWTNHPTHRRHCYRRSSKGCVCHPVVRSIRQFRDAPARTCPGQISPAPPSQEVSRQKAQRGNEQGISAAGSP